MSYQPCTVLATSHLDWLIIGLFHQTFPENWQT